MAWFIWYSPAKSIKEGILEWYNEFWGRKKLLRKENLEDIGENTPIDIEIEFDIRVHVRVTEESLQRFMEFALGES